MRELSGWLKLVCTLWMAAAAAVHLYFGGFGFPEPIPMRGFHLLIFTPILFLLYPANPKSSPMDKPSLLDWALAVLSAVPHAWVMWNWTAIADRMEYVDTFTPTMLALGIICVLTLLEAIRRAVEPGLAWMIVISIAYMVWGHHVPGLFQSKTFQAAAIVEAIWLVPTSGGVYGPLTGIVATTIAIFILFGAFMGGSGTGRLFSNFGAAVAGRYSGGPAKVAVVTSGLFGTMSGSSVSNVITTGAATIPLMTRVGFKPSVAGGIESAASVGGALMPPVMGAAAFVMAEITNIPYGEIVVAAAIGAVLYYFSILIAVHFEAKRAGINRMAEEDIPSWREVLADAHLLLPIAVLVYFLMERWSGNFAAFCGTLAMVAIAMLRRRTRMSLAAILASLTNAGLTMAPLAVAIAGSGIVISALTETGLVVAFGGIIKQMAAGSLPMLLVLLAAAVLILGMGLPTTPSYIIAAAIGVPQLLDMGQSLMASHMFIFYFAVLADVSPPVAAAAFAAAAIAKASPTITSLHATRLGIAGFTVGFAFIYDPGIMFQGGAVAIIMATTIQVAALTAIAAGYAGYLAAPLNPALRVLVGGAGLLAAFWHGWSDIYRLAIVLAVLAGVALYQTMLARRALARA